LGLILLRLLQPRPSDHAAQFFAHLLKLGKLWNQRFFQGKDITFGCSIIVEGTLDVKLPTDEAAEAGVREVKKESEERRSMCAKR
jgi:hypothetical protein